jgi:hypothetical protein
MCETKQSEGKVEKHKIYNLKNQTFTHTHRFNSRVFAQRETFAQGNHTILSSNSMNFSMRLFTRGNVIPG